MAATSPYYFRDSLAAQVMKIKELTAAGASQLAVDLEYLRKARAATYTVGSCPLFRERLDHHGNDLATSWGCFLLVTT